jgi:ATP-dependent DNA helicase RecQ
LQNFVGHESFRGQQEVAVQAMLAGKDLLLIAPTGSGKSAVFQVHGCLLDKGFDLIVCPTNALIQNHLDELQSRISASGLDVQAKAVGTAFCSAQEEAALLELLSKSKSNVRWGTNGCMCVL